MGNEYPSKHCRTKGGSGQWAVEHLQYTASLQGWRAEGLLLYTAALQEAMGRGYPLVECPL